MIRLSAYIVKFLEENGVKDIFTVSGGGSIFLCDAFAKSKKINYYCNHHEQAVAFSGEGYARYKNDLGVSLVTTGPGGTNAISGVCSSWIDSVPHLFLSGQVYYNQTIRNTGLRQLGVQEINIIDLVKPITKYSVMVTNPLEIKIHLKKAIYQALTLRPGPVWLDIPADVQNALIDEDDLLDCDTNNININPKINKSDIKSVLDNISVSKSPLIIAGYGVRISNSVEQLLKFSEKTSIPILTTWNGDDIIDSNHKLFMGRPGAFGSRGPNFMIQNSDYILCIGTRLPFMVTGYNSHDFGRNAKIFMVDIDNNELNKNNLNLYKAIHADSKEFLDLCLLNLKNKKYIKPNNWLSFCNRLNRKYPVILPNYKKQENTVNSYYFTEILSKNICSDDVVVTDMGLSFVGTHQSLKLNGKQRLLTNSGFAPMGWGLPASIGACIAKNKKKIICITGDGGLMMNIQELATIMHNKLPIKIFIFNNGGYLTIKQTQQLGFKGHLMGSNSESGISFPDFTVIGKAHNISTTRIKNHTNLNSRIKIFLNKDGPGICELILDNEQEQIPKAINKRDKFGKTTPTKFEDMYPFLDKKELQSNLNYLDYEKL